MPSYTIFDANTGAVLRTISGSVSPSLAAKQSTASDEIVADGAVNDAEVYFDGPDAVPRPQIDIPEAVVADGVFSWALEDLPEGTQFTASRENDAEWSVSETIDDGVLEFETDFPGLYLFTLAPPFPWKRTRVRVEYALPEEPEEEIEDPA